MKDIHFVGFTFKKNLDELSEENFNSLVNEILSTGKKKTSSKKTEYSDKKTRAQLVDTLSNSALDILKKQRTVDSQPTTKTESPKEDLKIKNKLQYSSSFVGRKELSVLREKKEDLSAFTRMLLVNKKNNSSGKQQKKVDIQISSSNQLSKPQKKSQTGIKSNGNIKRNTSLKSKKPLNSIVVNQPSRILKNLGKSLLLKDQPPTGKQSSPKGQSQFISMTACPITTMNTKRIIQHTKTNPIPTTTTSTTKSRLKQNIRDIQTKTKGTYESSHKLILDHQPNAPSTKRSFKNI